MKTHCRCPECGHTDTIDNFETIEEAEAEADFIGAAMCFVSWVLAFCVIALFIVAKGDQS